MNQFPFVPELPFVSQTPDETQRQATTVQIPGKIQQMYFYGAILTVFPVDAKEYIALLPLDENGQNESGEVYLYAFARTESGDPMLSNIESDEEYAKAAVAFDTVLQNAKDSMDKIDWSVKEFHM